MFRQAINKAAKRSLSLSSRKQQLRLEPGDAGRLTDFGTRRIFDEDHDAFRDMCRKWFNDVVVPEHPKWEETGVVPREIWENAGENGLLGCQTSDEWGGIGAEVKHAAIVWEEQSYSYCSGPGFALHSDICMPYIENWGTKEQKEKYLADMTAGKVISAIAMTEPGAGSDLQGITTVAKQDGGDLILNGSKTFITNGQNADLTIVVAITNPQAKSAAHGISLILVEGGDEGFKRGTNLKKMGMKAQDTSELFFEDVRIPMDRVIGGEKGLNRGFYMLMSELPQERLLIGAMSTAKCEAMFETTRDYVRERQAFGKPISAMQDIRQKLAHMKTEICIGRAFVDQCIEQHQDEQLSTVAASMCKFSQTELEGRVADQCVQMHGGWGYMWDYDVCKAFVDARVQRIYGGTNEVMKDIISRDIVKPQ